MGKIDGRHDFFVKPLNEWYGMYDWLPMWVKISIHHFVMKSNALPCFILVEFEIDMLT